LIISLFIFSAIIIMLFIFVCLYRGIKGPTVADRIVAINVIGTKTIIIIIMVSFIFHETFFIDVALIYALINFIATLGIARYLGGLK
jgi:multicomponent Na+:H+ antiporter subunit F